MGTGHLCVQPRKVCHVLRVVEGHLLGIQMDDLVLLKAMGDIGAIRCMVCLMLVVSFECD